MTQQNFKGGCLSLEVSAEGKLNDYDTIPTEEADMLTNRHTFSLPYRSMKKLSFSVCPYESTIESVHEPADPEELPSKFRKLSMGSVRSGSSRRSIRSNRSSLQQVFLFEQTSKNHLEYLQKCVKESQAEQQALRSNLRRLQERRDYLDKKTTEHKQSTVSSAHLLQTALRKYFRKPKRSPSKRR